MSQDPKAIVRQYVHTINTILHDGNATILDHVTSANYRSHQGGQTSDLDSVKQGLLAVRTAFPDLENTEEMLISEGDLVVSRNTARGTHVGTFFGIAPTGRTVVVETIDIFRVANDKVAERWAVTDTLGVLMQLGALPSSG